LLQVVLEIETLQQFQQASKHLPGRKFIDICCIRSCIPAVTTQGTGNAGPVTGSPSATASQRGTLGACFLFWSFPSI